MNERREVIGWTPSLKYAVGVICDGTWQAMRLGEASQSSGMHQAVPFPRLIRFLKEELEKTVRDAWRDANQQVSFPFSLHELDPQATYLDAAAGRGEG